MSFKLDEHLMCACGALDNCIFFNNVYQYSEGLKCVDLGEYHLGFRVAWGPVNKKVTALTCTRLGGLGYNWEDITNHKCEKTSDGNQSRMVTGDSYYDTFIQQSCRIDGIARGGDCVMMSLSSFEPL